MPGVRELGRGLGRAATWEAQIGEGFFSGDPMRIDYGYRRNGTRGFVQLIYMFAPITEKNSLTLVTGHELLDEGLGPVL